MKEHHDPVLAQIKERLAAAVKAGDYDEILSLGKIAKDWESLLTEDNRISERKKAIMQTLNGERSPDESSGQAVNRDRLSPQQRGNAARDAFVRHLASRNVVLRKLRTKRYQTPSGLEIGIAYAKELDIRPDTWFLGLVDERFDAVVLLCEAEAGPTLDFLLPPDIVKKYWSSLSRSHGQVKFHVERFGAVYQLRVPGGRKLSITQYMGSAEGLRS